jgi:hypothetical protein
VTLRANGFLAATIICCALTGCGPEVGDPLTPEGARYQVIDAARDVSTILHADIAEANFSYESCNDQGDPPFRGKVQLLLWMPGAPHDQAVDPQQVLKPLEAHGWSTNSAFISHSPALTKNNVNTMITVTHQPPPGEHLGAHVVAEVLGECRDIFDHRTDRSILPVDVLKDVQPS